MVSSQEIKLLKRELRKKKLAERAQLSREERQAKSQEICRLAMNLPIFKEAQQIMLYLDFREEVETTALAEVILAEGKELVIPCCLNKVMLACKIYDLQEDITTGTWGIREPCKERMREADPKQIDLVIAPGVVFDRRGNRIGYGAGYYDRFLPQLRTDTPVIAFAFACQVTEKILADEYDYKMSLLITENGVIYPT